MGRSKSTFLLGSCLGSFGPLVGPVWAQDSARAAEALAEIVVTARRREETSQELPGVVQSLSGDTLAALGARGIEDVVGLTPGVEFVNSTSEPGNNDIIIRGGGAGRFINTDSSVGLYQNGAYISGGNLGGRTLSDTDLFDLERVEVLKGPQGALLGRNALGGSINVLSRRPDYKDAGGEVSVGLAQGEGRAIEASFERPLVEDKLAIRVAGRSGQRDEGFFYNPYLGVHTDQFQEALARTVITARFSPDIELTLQGDYYDVERGGATAADLDVVGDVFNWAQDDANRGAQTQYNGLASLKWDLGGATLTALVNHRRRDGQLREDLDQGVASSAPFNPTAQLACYTVTRLMVTTTPSNQRCLSESSDDFDSTFYNAYLQNDGGPVNWIIGADFLEASDAYVLAQSGRDVNDYRLRTTNEVESFAVWGGVEFGVDDLSFGIDARHTMEDKQQSSRATQTFGANAGIDVYNNALDFSFEKTTYATFARYAFSKNVSAYGKIGTGFRSGGLNVDARDIDNPATVPVDPVVVPDAYGPENALAYELGLRSEWFDGALRANVTIFQIEYEGFVQNLNNGLPGASRVQYVSNTGDAEVRGVEYEVGGRWREPFGGALVWQIGAVSAKSEITSGRFTGLRVTRLPDWSLSARLLYRHRLVGDWDWRLGARYTQQRGGFTAAANTVALQEPTILNLTAGVSSPDWDLTLVYANATDEDEPLNFTVQNVVSPRTPRNWRVRISRTF